MNGPQHVHRARLIGMAENRIASIKGPLADMTPDDALLAQAVDELFDAQALSPTIQSKLFVLVGKTGLFDLIATVGFYTTLGFILNSFDVPLDDDIATDLVANPAP